MMGARLAFISTLVLVGLFSSFAADGQEVAKVARIGYLGTNLAAGRHMQEAFLQGLRDLGYVEGRNLVIEYRDAEGQLDRLPALAADLVALRVDVVVAPTIVAALAAKQATRTLPIVFALVADPVGGGLVTSLARPGGNVTGVSNLSSDLFGKRLELLKQAVPGVSRVAVLWQPRTADQRVQNDQLREAEVAAPMLGMRLQFVEARTPADLDKALSDMTKARPGALTLLGDSNLFFAERRRLVELVARHRLPAVYTAQEFVAVGGLMSYSVSFPDLSRRSAVYVDKILKGARPQDLPVEQPTKFELVINLKTARTLGLTIPPSLLARADQVIEK